MPTLPVEMRSALRACVLVLIVAAAACATPAGPARIDIATGIRERTGVDGGALPYSRDWAAPPGVAIDDGWTIDESVSAALWNNADFQAALSGLGLARADLVDAGLLKNPILSLLFPIGPKQFEAALNLPIDAIWQRPRRIAEATVNAEIVAQQLVAHGLRLIAEVKTAYVDVLAADASFVLARTQAAAARRIADLAAGRFRAGDISDLEARLASTDAARLESAAITRQSTRDLAQVRLRALIGLDPTAPPMRLADTPAPALAACGPLPELLKAAMAARPDVRAAELQVEAAGARAGLEKARILTLTATLDVNGEGKEGFEMGPGLAVELPIVSQNQGKRARAAAELEQAARRYLALRAAIAANIASAVARLDAAQQAGRVLNADARASIVTQRMQAQRLFDAGEISLLELLLAQQRLTDVEIAAVDANLAAWRATIGVEDAIGRSCGPR